jgi:hypothetical protein
MGNRGRSKEDGKEGRRIRNHDHLRGNMKTILGILIILFAIAIGSAQQYPDDRQYHTPDYTDFPTQDQCDGCVQLPPELPYPTGEPIIPLQQQQCDNPKWDPNDPDSQEHVNCSDIHGMNDCTPGMLCETDINIEPNLNENTKSYNPPITENPLHYENPLGDDPNWQIPATDIPEITTPDTPEVTTPDTPEVTTPDTPEVTTPDTPEVTTPDTPEVTTPDTPEVTPVIDEPNQEPVYAPPTNAEISEQQVAQENYDTALIGYNQQSNTEPGNNNDVNNEAIKLNRINQVWNDNHPDLEQRPTNYPTNRPLKT